MLSSLVMATFTGWLSFSPLHSVWGQIQSPSSQHLLVSLWHKLHSMALEKKAALHFSPSCGSPAFATARF
jgi:hypothetical protein